MIDAVHPVLALLPDWLDPAWILSRYGLPAVVAIIFAECGLLFGFFLPGDTLLLSAGVLTRAGTIDEPLWVLLVLVPLAAILGNVVGYAIGAWAGPPLLRGGSRWIRQEHVDRSAAFFARHGPLAIVLARFVPVVRTFIGLVAGASGMDRRVFVLWSAVGGVLWTVGLILVGYALGDIPFVRDNVDALILTVLGLFVGSMVLGGLRDRRRRSRASAGGPSPPADPDGAPPQALPASDTAAAGP